MLAAAFRRPPFHSLLAALFVALLAAATLTGASASIIGYSADDPPSRVARIAEATGEVLRAGDHGDWQPVARNHPLIRGDNLYVGPDARVEVDFGAAQLWLGPGTQIFFERIDDEGVAARLGAGLLAVRIGTRGLGEKVTVTTNAGIVSTSRPGLFVLDAGDGRVSAVALDVRSGRVDVDGSGWRQVVAAGRQLAFDAAGIRYDERLRQTGNFQAWVTERDRFHEIRPRGWSDRWDDGLIGLRDLDAYGRWDHHAAYGRVWFPTAAPAGWAPFRYGRWTYIRPWGWTWIDDAPWGFAPSHYGRWVRIGGRWAWCPGIYMARPVYAPALVTFFGGSGWQVGISFGPAFAWAPLGWNEPYTPWYGYSPLYWRNINQPYVRNVTEDPWRPPRYIHAGVRDAVTAMPVTSFLGGRPVAEHLINVPGIDPRSAPPARMHEYTPQWIRPRDRDLPAPALPTVRPSDVAPVIPGTRAEFGRLPVVERQMPPGPVAAPGEPRIWQDPNPVAQPAPVAQSAPMRPPRELRGSEPAERPMLRPPVVREPVAPLAREERRERMQQSAPMAPAAVHLAAPPSATQPAAAAPAVEVRKPARVEPTPAEETRKPKRISEDRP